MSSKIKWHLNKEKIMIRYDIQEWDEEFQWDDLVDKKLKEVFLKDQFYPFQR